MRERTKNMQKKDPKQIMQEFEIRQSRQIIVIAAALFLVLLCAVIYKRPDFFGEISKSTLYGMQALIIASFIGFTAVNWKCPSCGKYLGSDIHRRTCKHCRSRLR